MLARCLLLLSASTSLAAAPPLTGHAASPTPAPTPSIVYDEPTAILMARLSGAAYNASGLERCLASAHMSFPTLTALRVYDDGEYLAFTAVDEARKAVYLTFRGTASTEQLIKDLQSATHTPFLSGTRAACRASNYFTDAADAHYDEIVAELAVQRAAWPGFTLFVTGHSLGGAMAALTALRLVTEGAVASDALQLYTFGMPRCGDFTFAQHMKRLVPNSFRVVYRADPVAHTPQCKSAPTPDITKKLFGECVAATSFLEPLWAFHFGTEVWYPSYGLLNSGSGMPDILYDSRDDDPKAAGLPPPTLCTGAPFGEDEACSNSVANSAGGLGMNGLDHLAYFAPEHSAVKLSEVCMNRVESKLLLHRAVATGAGVLLSLSLSAFCLVFLIYCVIRRTKLRKKEHARREEKAAKAQAAGEKNPTNSFFSSAVTSKKSSRARIAL